MAVDQVAIAAAVNAQLALVNAAIAAVDGPLAQATLQQLAPVSDAIANALVVFDACTAALDADIDTSNAGGVAAGIPAPQMIAALTVQESEVNQLSVLIDARAYLARVGVNIQQATG